MKKILKLFPYLFYTLLIVFLILYVQSIDLDRLQEISLNWWYFALATILALTFRYWGAYIWTVLLRSLGASNVRFSNNLIYVYAKSWLGRYIPGTAPWILGKIYFASKQGLSKNKLAVSSMLEGGLQIIVQMVFALSLLGLDPRLDIIPDELKLLFLATTIACLVVLVPPVFNKMMSLAYKVVKKKVFSREHYASSKTIGKGFSLYVFGTILGSLSLFFIAKAVYPELDYDQMIFVMGVGTLASAASMLAVFAPSGIGVREGIQLALLSLIMPTEIAFAITIITRLWSVACDLLFFALAKLSTHKRTT